MRNAMWVGGGITGMGEIPILGVREKGIAKVIRDIFRNGGQGFAYDPNDLSTMFQDAAGTIPVTAVGQPVGLILDKSKGLVLGGDLVTNGDFGSNLTNWIVSATSPASVTIVGGAARIYSPAGESVLLRQPLVVQATKLYEVSFDVLAMTGSAYIALHGGAIGSQSRYDFNSTGHKKIILKPADASDLIFARAAACDCVIDNVSVKELSGNHAYQTTSASRPILRKNVITGAYYLAFDGADDFLQTNAIDFTSTDKMSLFAGVRKLNDGVNSILYELSTVAGTGNPGSFRMMAPESGSQYDTRSTGTVDSTTYTQNAAYKAPHSAVLTAISQISADTNILRVNGTQVSSVSYDQGTGNYGNYPLYIGRRAGTTFPFNGHIYSLIGIGRLTTDSETAALEKVIAKNVGVTL